MKSHLISILLLISSVILFPLMLKYHIIHGILMGAIIFVAYLLIYVAVDTYIDNKKE